MSIKVTFEFDETSGQLLGTSLGHDSAAGTTPAAPQKRGRGRPVKAEEAAPAAPAAPAAAPEADPFETSPAVPAPPVATLDEVRVSLKALAAATDQATALKLLKDVGGAANLSDLVVAKYGLVAAAAKAALPAAPTAEADPFGEAPAPAAPVKAFTREDVKAAVVAAQKITGTDVVQKVVMKHGGKASDGNGGAEKPSLQALPEAAFAAVIAELQALPKTK